MSKKGAKARKHALKSKQRGYDSEGRGAIELSPHKTLRQRCTALMNPRKIEHYGTALMSSISHEYASKTSLKNVFGDDSKSTRLGLAEYSGDKMVAVEGIVSGFQWFGGELKLMLSRPCVYSSTPSKGLSTYYAYYEDEDKLDKQFQYETSIKPFDSHVWLSLSGIDCPRLEDGVKLPIFFGDTLIIGATVSKYKSGVKHRYGLGHKFVLHDSFIQPVHDVVKTEVANRHGSKTKVDKYLSRLIEEGDFRSKQVVVTDYAGRFYWQDAYNQDASRMEGWELGYLERRDGKVVFVENTDRNDTVDRILSEGATSESRGIAFSEWMMRYALPRYDELWYSNYIVGLRLRNYYAPLYNHMVKYNLVDEEFFRSKGWLPTAKHLSESDSYMELQSVVNKRSL